MVGAGKHARRSTEGTSSTDIKERRCKPVRKLQTHITAQHDIQNTCVNHTQENRGWNRSRTSGNAVRIQEKHRHTRGTI